MINKFYSILIIPFAIVSSEFLSSSINSVASNDLSAVVNDQKSQKNNVLLSLKTDSSNMKIVLSEIPSDTKFENYITDNLIEVRLFLKNTIKPITPQSLSFPEAGLKTISIKSSNGELILSIIPTHNTKINNPEIILKDNKAFIDLPNLKVSEVRQKLNNPFQLNEIKKTSASKKRSIPKPPPLGDIAVGTSFINNPNLVNIKGPNVSMVFKNTPAREAIEYLISQTEYGFVYVQDDPTFKDQSANSTPTLFNEQASQRFNQPISNSNTEEIGSSDEKTSDAQRYITLSIKDQAFDVAFNTLLMASGLQATIQNNIVYVGPSVRERIFLNRISRVYRLNQTTASAAASYLANLGAKVSITSTVTTAVSSGQSESDRVAGSETSSTTTNSTETKIQVYGASAGPLLGLMATTDDRLQTITLLGSPQLVDVAEGYIKQLDLRQRQVALTVKILDINISDGNTFNNSWAFKTGNQFIVNSGGKLLGAFGNLLPPNEDDFLVSSTPTTNPVKTPYDNQSIVDFLQASIASENTKILASPTLILNEYPGKTGGDTVTFEDVTTALTAGTIGRSYGNEAFIIVGSQVPVNCEVEEESTVPTFEYGISGLTFGARVLRIDDNGYVTFSISPAVSVSGGTRTLQGCGDITLLATRRLDSGSIRIRDGNTLILTGVLNSTDQETVTKFPILGDLPLLGRLFRNSSSNKEQRELVILVTPQIIKDSYQDVSMNNSGYIPKSSEIKKLINQD